MQGILMNTAKPLDSCCCLPRVLPPCLPPRLPAQEAERRGLSVTELAPRNMDERRQVRDHAGAVAASRLIADCLGRLSERGGERLAKRAARRAVPILCA